MKVSLRKLVDKYGSMSAPVKASIWFVVCNVVQKGISLISTPIFTRILTTEQYGVYSVYQSWYSIIIILATLNLYAGVCNNGLTKFPAERNVFISSLQGLSWVFTLGLFLVYLCGRDFWNGILGLSTIFVIAMFLQAFFEPGYLFWTISQRYDYKYKGILVTTLIMAIGSPLLGIVTVLHTTYKAEARVLSYVFVQVAMGLVFCIINLMKGRTLYRKDYWKYAIVFNGPLIPHYLSMTILNQSDRIMISSMVGKSYAAVYSIAYTLAMMMSVVTSAINNSFIPYTYKGLKAKEYKEIRKSANILLVLVGVGCTIAMALGPELIKIFATEEYYEAIWVMPPVAASVFFMFLYPLFANVEFYYEKTKFVMVASCIGAAANVLLNYIFIREFGYIAAGYTTLSCYILFAFAHYWFHKRILKENNISELYDIRFIFMLSVIILIIMMCIAMTYNYPVIRYSALCLFVLVGIAKRKTVLGILKQIQSK